MVGNSKDQVDFDAIPCTNNASETNTLVESIGINQAESLVYHEDLHYNERELPVVGS